MISALCTVSSGLPSLLSVCRLRHFLDFCKSFSSYRRSAGLFLSSSQHPAPVLVFVFVFVTTVLILYLAHLYFIAQLIGYFGSRGREQLLDPGTKAQDTRDGARQRTIQLQLQDGGGIRNHPTLPRLHPNRAIGPPYASTQLPGGCISRWSDL